MLLHDVRPIWPEELLLPLSAVPPQADRLERLQQ